MVKYKKPLIISLVCILMVSGLLIAWSASSRLLRAYDYASQFATAARVSDSSTNLSLVVYSDPQSLRQSIGLFEFVKAQNIEWRGTTTDPQGNPTNVALKVGSVYLIRAESLNNYIRDMQTPDDDRTGPRRKR